jgi:hypothetical protein
VPQVTLHGFDEGLVQKLNHGAVETLVQFCMDEYETPAAQVKAKVLHIRYIIQSTCLLNDNTLYNPHVSGMPRYR